MAQHTYRVILAVDVTIDTDDQGEDFPGMPDLDTIHDAFTAAFEDAFPIDVDASFVDEAGEEWILTGETDLWSVDSVEDHADIDARVAATLAAFSEPMSVE